MPIEGLPGSNQQAAAAAAGGIIGTGFERSINKDKIANSVDLNAAVPFKSVFLEMIAPDALDQTGNKREKKPHEEEMSYTQRMALITERKLRSSVKKASGPRIKTQEKGEEKEEKKEPAGLAPREYMTSIDNIKKIEVNLVKDYIGLFAGRMAARSAAEKEKLDSMVKSAETALIEAGLTINDIRYLDYKTQEILKRIFLLAIKDRFIISLTSPKDMAEYLVKTDKPISAIDYLSSLEKDFVNMTNIAGLMKKYDLKDLIGISDFLKVDIDYWVESFNKENIAISNIEDFYRHYAGALSVADFSPAVSSFRALSVELYLAEGLFKSISMRQKVRKQEKNLTEIGLTRKDVEDIKSQGRRIAWLKTISSLKEQHLKRILTSTSDDFEKESKKIEQLTKKARGLGYDIPAEGLKWIDTGLEQLAYNSAAYKSELLKSMQKMAFDQKREKDIKHLASILAALKNKAKG
ncbi:MAG: hypothetical protein AABZ57_03565 [Candidatus Margulisiibacteriota bacterium]